MYRRGFRRRDERRGGWLVDNDQIIIFEKNVESDVLRCGAGVPGGGKNTSTLSPAGFFVLARFRSAVDFNMAGFNQRLDPVAGQVWRQFCREPLSIRRPRLPARRKLFLIGPASISGALIARPGADQQ